eukprot:CAMPEP_0174291798 /NCGR_PEP_ID=MMETSP0809-20121228/33255_1 /TAXON_ID=73025 ORGANISM="Eutreptiella gymnastica-like, Strain CCMP1594" /NCGR_SAMPLE_ID=MMETSP0809 /ASSEMBLY_ACC=CAM_ASM_000658 /LENGTH=604 /DNA_ID=CAMNT_0015391399 /DNA_START=57 /DNA_END=1871 /DNA_ORIENTATION=+
MQNTYFFHPKHSVGKRDLLHLAASEVQLHGMDQGGHVKDKQPVVSLKDQLSHGVSKDEKPPQGSDAMYKLGSEARTRGAQQAMVVDLQASPPRQRCEQRQEQHEHNHSHLRNNPLTALAANRLRDVEPLRLHRIMEALYGEDILLKDLIPLLNPSPCACEKSRCRRGADSPNSTATNSPRPARGEASGYRPGANSPNSQATISSAALQGKALDHGLEDVRIVELDAYNARRYNMDADVQSALRAGICASATLPNAGRYAYGYSTLNSPSEPSPVAAQSPVSKDTPTSPTAGARPEDTTSDAPAAPTSADGTHCTHVQNWKRLRSKRGYTYFVCYSCGAKWRIAKSDRTDPSDAYPDKDVDGIQQAVSCATNGIRQSVSCDSVRYLSAGKLRIVKNDCMSPSNADPHQYTGALRQSASCDTGGFRQASCDADGVAQSVSSGSMDHLRNILQDPFPEAGIPTTANWEFGTAQSLDASDTTHKMPKNSPGFAFASGFSTAYSMDALNVIYKLSSLKDTALGWREATFSESSRSQSDDDFSQILGIFDPKGTPNSKPLKQTANESLDNVINWVCDGCDDAFDVLQQSTGHTQQHFAVGALDSLLRLDQ